MTIPYAATPSKPETPVLSIAHQASRRYPDTFFDRHIHREKAIRGRPFWGFREFSAVQGRPDGFVGGDVNPGECVFDDAGHIDRHASLMAAWDAPILPEVKYFDFDYRRQRITIRYDKWKRDLVEAEAKYFEAAARTAASLRTAQVYYRGPGTGRTPDFEITAIVGMPSPSPKIPDALQGGDAWGLGFSDDVNVELAKMLGMNELGMKIRNYYLFADEPALTPAAVLAAPSAADLDRLINEAVERRMAAKEAQTAAAEGAKAGKTSKLTKIADGVELAATEAV